MMMEMPEVVHCFGMFPPKYGCFLISLFGMGFGGIGLAGIVLYGLVEDSIISHFVNTSKLDDGLKKATLLTIGLSSLMLLIGNGLLFLGVTFRARQAVETFVWVIFVLISILTIAAIAAPMSCFFISEACLIKKISSALMTVLYLFLLIYLECWVYFMVVGYNFAQSL
ncbi:uncharacterized protein LOC115453717 [Manduca sexta]|uniref:Uncharacterized protein n=1 Tax=Manduca sexta TaxID=7130 RepID=A0A921ZWA8_MANSE|nr:uncharacterized protein LOC115453717 [Manduca sexta]KAG6465286.1 hypothetical protein O3G_MSEX015051 [Manduca sexta]